MLLGRKPIQARLIFTSCIRCPLLLSGAQTYILITEQVFTIGDMPKQDLQKLPYTLFQNTRKDEVRFAHVFSLLAGRWSRQNDPAILQSSAWCSSTAFLRSQHNRRRRKRDCSCWLALGNMPGFIGRLRAVRRVAQPSVQGFCSCGIRKTSLRQRLHSTATLFT